MSMLPAKLEGCYEGILRPMLLGYNGFSQRGLFSKLYHPSLESQRATARIRIKEGRTCAKRRVLAWEKGRLPVRDPETQKIRAVCVLQTKACTAQTLSFSDLQPTLLF